MRSDEFRDAVKVFVLSGMKPKLNENDINLNIVNTEEFMVGRFFLPRLISLKPQVTYSKFRGIRLTTNSTYFKKRQGLCFRISCNIENQDFHYYHIFDLINKNNWNEQKEVFKKFLNIVIKKKYKTF